MRPRAPGSAGEAEAACTEAVARRASFGRQGGGDTDILSCFGCWHVPMCCKWLQHAAMSCGWRHLGEEDGSGREVRAGGHVHHDDVARLRLQDLSRAHISGMSHFSWF